MARAFWDGDAAPWSWRADSDFIASGNYFISWGHFGNGRSGLFFFSPSVRNVFVCAKKVLNIHVSTLYLYLLAFECIGEMVIYLELHKAAVNLHVIFKLAAEDRFCVRNCSHGLNRYIQ